ncbi:MAG: hypothetical protein Ct9H90mP25_1230 [Gammaproteobacteria bacterium]|nr:MAG: hypothetical protein Ct9H90mP25_1230 [Gammaproteobacteria bacterium]
MKILGKWAETICIFSRMAVAGRRFHFNESENLPFRSRYKVEGSSRRETYIFQTLKTIKSVLLVFLYFRLLWLSVDRSRNRKSPDNLDTSLQLGLLTGLKG